MQTKWVPIFVSRIIIGNLRVMGAVIYLINYETVTSMEKEETRELGPYWLMMARFVPGLDVAHNYSVG